MENHEHENYSSDFKNLENIYQILKTILNRKSNKYSDLVSKGNNIVHPFCKSTFTTL